MGTSPNRKYPYPNPTGDGADVSYWAQRLAAALDVDMVATLAAITAVVATAASNTGKIATNLGKINALTTRTTTLEGRNSAITSNTSNIAANLAKIVALTTRVLGLENRTPYIMHTGRSTVTLPIGFSGNNINVAFPDGGFDVVPNVVVSMSENVTGDASKVFVHSYDETKTGFRIDVGTSDNQPSSSLYSFTIIWYAVQMKAGSANG